MPIVIPTPQDSTTAPQTTTAQSATPKYYPRFFSSKLTGRGKRNGRVQNNTDPRNQAPFDDIEIFVGGNRSDTSGDTTTDYITTAAMPSRVYAELVNTNAGTTHPILQRTTMQDHKLVDYYNHNAEIITVLTTDGAWYGLSITPQHWIIRTQPKVNDDGTTDPKKKESRATTVWRVTVYANNYQFSHDTMHYATYTQRELAHDAAKQMKPSFTADGYQGVASVDFTETVTTELIGVMIRDIATLMGDSTLSDITNVHRNLDTAALDNYCTNYPAFDITVAQAEFTATEGIKDYSIDMIHDIGAGFIQNTGGPNYHALYPVGWFYKFLNTYQIELETYRDIYQALLSTNTHAPDAMRYALNFLISCNAYIKLTANLDALGQQKATLPRPTTNDASQVPSYFSNQQRTAITTHEPLVLIQAGAGAGKTTVITGRIDYLMQNGVAPADITALSFTNVAADTLLERMPGIQSLTIDRLMHENYQVNFPKQKLCTLTTLCNTLTIHEDTLGATGVKAEQIAEFMKLTSNMAQDNSIAAVTQLTNFIESYPNEVVTILNAIEQTTLELEVIISTALMEQLYENYPAPQHLIVDEVQDTSVHQFNYILRYAAKHGSALYLVGDSSQTLYEFRSANPKALNMLEQSGDFATYKLSTNYRSNQEILDYANVLLNDIEANRYAQIQLQANAIHQQSLQTMQEKVHVHYVEHKQTKNSLFGTAYTPSLRDWIKQRMDKGEKVAFLAHSNNDVNSMQKVLSDDFGEDKVVNITSKRVYNQELFSKFIANHWDEVVAVGPYSAAFTFTKQIEKRAPQLGRGDAAKLQLAAKKLAIAWWSENSAHIQRYIDAFATNAMTQETFFAKLQKNILDFEIKRNVIAQSVIGEENRKRREENLTITAPLIVSTIHSAKGMEFDHVVILHKPPRTTSISEADKRMYYVAFTRAMKSEYIITTGSDAAVVAYGIVLGNIAKLTGEKFHPDMVSSYITTS